MSNDLVQSWLNAAGRFPLLPKSEMIRLANKRDRLEPGSKAYNKVINKICEHNLRLVPNVVRSYLAKRIGYNMSSPVAADLLQQGYIGLRRAAEKFDASRGYTFATYAQPWIYQSVTRWHNSHDRTVYIPENTMCELLYRKRHGKPSKSKNGRISQEVLGAAERSISIGSIDVNLGQEEDGQLIDLLSNENRLIETTSTDENQGVHKLKDLMAECGIKPRTQDIVLGYTRRGRMSIVASKLSLSPKHCQNLYQEAVRVMKYRVEQKESAKKAALYDRLGK